MPLDIPTDFHIDRADYERDLDALRAVREPVFQVEQGVPADLEWDADDVIAIHLLARDMQERPIGAARLTPDGRIGRMAVLPEWRGRGVGAALVVRLLDIARERGQLEVSLHAQVHAIPFYAGLGFVAEGEVFLDAGIEHRVMRRLVDVMTPPPRTPPASVDAEQVVDTPAACRDAVQALLDQTRHRLYLFCADLDPNLFCTAPALAALRRIAVSGKRADIRILIQDPVAALRSAAPLIALAQRLPSAIRLRTPLDETDQRNPATYLLDDGAGYLHLPAGRPSGVTQRHGPARHRQLSEDFERAWEQSEAPVELRQIRL
ncbi:MAG: GNAT family N-acetyltransferase [Lysobacteraceae bacterium]|jgi:predicted GNAT family N-acyltransferase